jgi:hypothetical protein
MVIYIRRPMIDRRCAYGSTGRSRLYIRLASVVAGFRPFARPLRTSGSVRPGPWRHIETDTPQECGLVVRQLEASFTVSRLEKQEIFYWLGIVDDRRPVLMK